MGVFLTADGPWRGWIVGFASEVRDDAVIHEDAEGVAARGQGVDGVNRAAGNATRLWRPRGEPGDAHACSVTVVRDDCAAGLTRIDLPRRGSLASQLDLAANKRAAGLHFFRIRTGPGPGPGGVCSREHTDRWKVFSPSSS